MLERRHTPCCDLATKARLIRVGLIVALLAVSCAQSAPIQTTLTPNVEETIPPATVSTSPPSGQSQPPDVNTTASVAVDGATVELRGARVFVPAASLPSGTEVSIGLVESPSVPVDNDLRLSALPGPVEITASDRLRETSPSRFPSILNTSAPKNQFLSISTTP